MFCFPGRVRGRDHLVHPHHGVETEPRLRGRSHCLGLILRKLCDESQAALKFPSLPTGNKGLKHYWKNSPSPRWTKSRFPHMACKMLAMRRGTPGPIPPRFQCCFVLVFRLPGPRHQSFSNSNIHAHHWRNLLKWRF